MILGPWCGVIASQALLDCSFTRLPKFQSDECATQNVKRDLPAAGLDRVQFQQRTAFLHLWSSFGMKAPKNAIAQTVLQRVQLKTLVEPISRNVTRMSHHRASASLQIKTAETRRRVIRYTFELLGIDTAPSPMV